jgi:hypothetical protein
LPTVVRLVVARMEAGEGREVILHLGLGEVREERVDLVLQRGLLREDNLGLCANRCKVGGIGDIKETLTVLSDQDLISILDQVRP